VTKTQAEAVVTILASRGRKAWIDEAVPPTQGRRRKNWIHHGWTVTVSIGDGYHRVLYQIEEADRFLKGDQ
jgi:hypothetical protein